MITREHSLKSTGKRGNNIAQPKPKPKPKHKPLRTAPKKIPAAIDRISKLPDHLLHHILFYLPLKQIGRTSILSHRWRHVWASMQKLAFYMDEFAKFGPEKFVGYVNAALPHRPKHDFQNFKAFLLTDSPTNLATSTRWISQAVKNYVRSLSVIIRPQSSGGNVILPRPVLTSHLLEDLGLFSFPNVKIITPSVISLSKLKILSLQRLRVNSAFLEKILSGCPTLENLNLHFCEIAFSGVHSVTLRSLVMESCRIQTKRENKFDICTPNLVHLHFNQGCGTLLCHESLDEMFNLDIRNLKSLVLGGYWVASYTDAVPFFLQHSPLLEKLTLICNQSPRENVLRSVNRSSNICFQCQNLNSVDIVCHESDKRISHLKKVLERNRISNLNFTLDCSSVEDDCLKMLYETWVWINDQMVDKKITQRRRSFRLL